MRIAYLCEFDAADISVMSGYPHAFLEQFERLGHEVVRVFPLSRSHRHLYLPHRLAYRAIGTTYRPDREIGYLRSLARQAERRLRDTDFDVAFAPGSHLVAEFNLPKPIVFCADASFASVVEQYWDFSNCSRRFLQLGPRQDQRAHDRCAAAIYPSDVFAAEAQASYHVSPAKVHAVPWGANFKTLAESTVRNAVERRPGRPLRILFIGKDWRRKGADIVLDTCRRLAAAGTDLQLDIVGITNVPGQLPPFVKSHGLLSKHDAGGYKALVNLLLGADLFFVPSRAENYGLVFCEAAAFGVPVVSTSVGGIPTIVKDGINGYLLPPSAGGDSYAELIATRLLDRDRRRALSLSALTDYHQRLTWDAFGRKCDIILSNAVEAWERSCARPG